MKFSKNLSNLMEQTQPDWRENFLTYKDLKKQLKEIYPEEKRGNIIIINNNNNKRQRLSGNYDQVGVMTCFVRLLEEEINKLNIFFMDKEEKYMIRLEVLQNRVTETLDSDEELMKIGREIVDFHGEMVLLLNYSALNFIGLVKILKKYDKRTGALVRLPFIKKVLQEPFFSTDILNSLVKECETMLDSFFPTKKKIATYQAAKGKEKGTVCGTDHKSDFEKVPEELAETKNVESQYMKQTIMALEVLNKIRSGSSTVSIFSLPPM